MVALMMTSRSLLTNERHAYGTYSTTPQITATAALKPSSVWVHRALAWKVRANCHE